MTCNQNCRQGRDCDCGDWDDMIESVNELRAVKYTQADIDAAVDAERERWAIVVCELVANRPSIGKCQACGHEHEIPRAG